MPWHEMSPMEQRLEFVHEYQTELFTMTELAAQYGISRKTGYKWLERFEVDGLDGLRDQSRRPRASPHATDPDLVDALVALRRRRPRWGATKLLTVAARRQPEADWPCRSTVCTLLKQRGLVDARRRRPPAAPGARSPRPPITRPNEVWTTDFKGEFRTGDGVYCYPLTLRDGFSRFVLRCDALLGRTTDATRRRFAARLPSMGCRTGFAATTAGRLRVPGSADCRSSPSGGSASALCRSGSRLAIPSRMGRTSNSMRSSKRTPRGRPPQPRSRSNDGSSAFVPTTTTSGRTRLWTTTRPRVATHRPDDRCPRACRPSTIPATWRSAS